MSDSDHKNAAWTAFVNRDPAPNHRQCFNAGWISGKGFAREEREGLRSIQAQKTMPLIGPLLDAWEGMPNDIKSDPGMEDLNETMRRIQSAMED